MTIISDLPEVQGSYRENVLLSKTTWFGVGGIADILFKPKNKEDLSFFLKNINPAIPITILGLASNILVRDGGIRGVVIKLGKEFNYITHQGNKVTSGAAVSDLLLSRYCLENDIAGFEFLSGIPGCVGGAIAMNAGCYGSEISMILDSVLAVNMHGDICELTKSDLNFSYRSCNLQEKMIFLEARFTGELSSNEVINQKMELIKKTRTQSQPINQKTGGSTFVNPIGSLKAWELIDQAGCRGLTIGGAKISELHCNFMINTGNATAHDLETLVNIVKEKVFEKTSVKLESEIKIIGSVDAK
jgi:UDP-N-acetylmuramate dehydrogenase